MIFGLPTATCEVGSLAAHDCLTARAAMDHIGLFLNDTWSFGRTTVNAGVRYDRYKGWLPEQEQIGATVGRASVPAMTFAERNLFTWNEVAPRVGVVFDLGGDGKTVLKANYGLYYHNPGVDAVRQRQSEHRRQVVDLGLERRQRRSPLAAGRGDHADQRVAAGRRSTSIPTISAPWTHEASAWVERQLTETMGLRAGFVYKNENNLFTPNNYQPLRGPSTYTAPFTFIDNGVDGVRGTADDRNIPMLGFPTANAAQFPSTIIVGNVDQYSHYKTIEASMNKRYANRWSASLGGNYTMLRDFPNNMPQNPNQPGVEDRSTWSFKATASYDAPFGIRISPVLRHQSGVNFARTHRAAGVAGGGRQPGRHHRVRRAGECEP